MLDKTALIDFLNSDSEVATNFFYQEYYTSRDALDEIPELQGFGITEVTLEDHYGGEGQGDDYWTVYKFTDGDDKTYIQFYGWYASYNGAEFTGFSVVNPHDKVITVWK